MLHVHVIPGLHAVFGIKRKTGADIDHFIHGDREDVVMEIAPRKGTLATCGAHCLRLVKYLVGKTVFILGTTLLDSKQYTIPQLAERYRARWGVEEWYKVSKQRMEVEDFHGPSERGVKQKLYAGFPLNAMTRRFSGHGDHRWNESPHEHGKPRKQTHFKHGLAMVAADIESLLLKQASALQETVTQVVRDIIRCRQRLRPGRSFERRSRKPVKM